jgi:hypothetical protein
LYETIYRAAEDLGNIDIEPLVVLPNSKFLTIYFRVHKREPSLQEKESLRSGQRDTASRQSLCLTGKEARYLHACTVCPYYELSIIDKKAQLKAEDFSYCRCPECNGDLIIRIPF